MTGPMVPAAALADALEWMELAKECHCPPFSEGIIAAEAALAAAVPSTASVLAGLVEEMTALADRTANWERSGGIEQAARLVEAALGRLADTDGAKRGN